MGWDAHSEVQVLLTLGGAAHPGTWLIENWPCSPGVRAGQSMQPRWLMTPLIDSVVICLQCMGKPGVWLPPIEGKTAACRAERT